MRPVALAIIAAAYCAAALWLAATGTGNLLEPFAKGMTIAMPIAVGLIVSLAPERARVLFVALGAILMFALAASLAVTVGWLPLAYFGFVGLWFLGGTVVGAITGALIPDIRIRAALAIVAAAAPALLEPFVPPTAVAALDATVTSRADVKASSLDLWEEVIGSDSVGASAADGTIARAAYPALVAVAVEEPRPLTVRTLVFADSTRVAERVVEWEDGDRLRVVAAPQAIAAPTGLAAWRAGWGEGAVVPSGATYEIAPADESAASLVLSGSYRMAMHTRVYPGGWLSRVARTRNDMLAAEFQSRAEVRARANQSALTAEMRQLRGQFGADLRVTEPAFPDVASTLPAFVNGDRAVEVVDEARIPAGSVAAAADRLRQTLRVLANRARTTGWFVPIRGIREAGRPPTSDSVQFEFEDYLGRCVSEVAALNYVQGKAVVGGSRRVACGMDVMAERARRSRLIAQLPLSAGETSDRWSVGLIGRGIARVYLDSVVLRADTLRLLIHAYDGTPQTVDSVVAALSVRTERSWYSPFKGSGFAVGKTFKKGEEWSRPRVRFSVPMPPSTDIRTVWPTFEVILTVPKTRDNPYGRAWTYSHAPMAYFSGVRR